MPFVRFSFFMMGLARRFVESKSKEWDEWYRNGRG